VGADLWYPPVSMVVEGAAREIADAVDERVEVVRASGAGDDAIVEETRRLRDGGFVVTAITSDRGLRARLEEAGAQVQSSGWLLERLG
jgi:rRNA-processing protein FCF1